jgi:hypothetical protein
MFDQYYHWGENEEKKLMSALGIELQSPEPYSNANAACPLYHKRPNITTQPSMLCGRDISGCVVTLSHQESANFLKISTAKTL